MNVYTYRLDETECMIIETFGCLYQGKSEEVVKGLTQPIQPAIYTDIYVRFQDAQQALNKKVMEIVNEDCRLAGRNNNIS